MERTDAQDVDPFHRTTGGLGPHPRPELLAYPASCRLLWFRQGSRGRRAVRSRTTDRSLPWT